MRKREPLREAVFLPANLPAIAEYVHLVGVTPFRRSRPYNAQTHECHIYCEDCGTALRVVGEAQSVGGSSRTPISGHMLAPQGHADTCRRHFKKAAAPYTSVNPALGFRIFINTSSNPNPYTPQRLSAEQRAMEIRHVRKVEDVADLLRKEDPARLSLSEVTFQGNVIPFNRFYLPIGSKDLVSLMEASRDRKPGAEPPFCAMEIETQGIFQLWKKEEMKNGLMAWRRQRPDIEKIKIGVDRQGRKEYLAVNVFVDNDHGQEKNIALIMQEPGRKLVMAEARYDVWEGERAVIHKLNLKTTRPEQVMVFDSRNVPWPRAGIRLNAPEDSPASP